MKELEDGTESECDEEEDDEGREESDEAYLDTLESELVDSIDLPALTREQVNLGRFSVHKIQQLSRKVFHSPTIRTELSKLCVANGIPDRVLIRAVPTRWNSVAEMLGRALSLRSVLPDLCDMAQFNRRNSVRLRRYDLEDAEWDLLAKLYPLLKVRLHFSLSCRFIH